MATIKSTSYNIYIGDKSFDELNKFLKKSNYTKYIIVCDENTISKCLPNLLFNCQLLNQAEIIELESGEENKTLETCSQVWGALTDISADKKSLLINLGGGVISDLGGFVASTFKRGIDFINIPTTLLAMVDASVGGKTGVDFDGIKNHIGTITEPKALFINPVFLQTLNERQLKNGFAEVIKIALIADASFWSIIKKIKVSKGFCSEQLITKAVSLKNEIVKKDLYEQSVRKSLNFGHTIGHAFEGAMLLQKHNLLHGEAIAFGMIIETQLAWQKKYISKKECNEIVNYINTIYLKQPLSVKTKQLLCDYIKHDKKNELTKLGFALVNTIGLYKFCESIVIEDVLNCLNNY